MYLLLSNQEIVEPLARQMLLKRILRHSVNWKILNKMSWNKSCTLEELQNAARKDLQRWQDRLVTEYKDKYRPLVAFLSERIDDLPNDRSELIDSAAENLKKSFAKTLAPQLTTNPRWVLASDNIDHGESILIRNITGNEHLLAPRIQEQQPFWFVDSGYTNFLTKKKNWHRLVRNHIHQTVDLKYFPADRLSTLPSTPQPWRRSGNKILVVESSDMHYRLFGTTLAEWCNRVHHDLKQVTTRPVEFRSKELDRKSRTSVYELLQNSSEYYCVISDASAAAIEAIWCGVPVITLNRHISNPVARSSISDIDNLYRGPIGDWLCALTYSQFTYKEFESGYAIEMLGTYHGITI